MSQLNSTLLKSQTPFRIENVNSKVVEGGESYKSKMAHDSGIIRDKMSAKKGF